VSGSSAGPVDTSQDIAPACASAEDSAPHALSETASTHSAPKNLWDQAYEALKMKNGDLVKAYGLILEAESKGELRMAANSCKNIF